MKKVFYLTNYREFGCVSEVDRLHILISAYVNEYLFYMEFIKVIDISLDKGLVIFRVYDTDLEEYLDNSISISFMEVV